MKHNVPVQSLIDHIKTAIDVDPWAKEMAEELLKERETIKPIYDEKKYGDHLPHCGNCEKVLPNNAVYGKVNFCHHCGQAVK